MNKIANRKAASVVQEGAFAGEIDGAGMQCACMAVSAMNVLKGYSACLDKAVSVCWIVLH